MEEVCHTNHWCCAAWIEWPSTSKEEYFFKLKFNIQVFNATSHQRAHKTGGYFRDCSKKKWLRGWQHYLQYVNLP